MISRSSSTNRRLFARWLGCSALACLSASGLDAEVFVIELTPQIEDVEVRIGDLVVGITDFAGRVAVDIEPGSHVVSLQKQGKTMHASRHFESGVSLHFILVGESDLGAQTKGYILETEVAGARVYVDRLYEGRTDSLGRIELPLVEGRDFRIEARKDGYRTIAEIFRTEPGIDFLPPLILERIEPRRVPKPEAIETPPIESAAELPPNSLTEEELEEDAGAHKQIENHAIPAEPPVVVPSLPEEYPAQPAQQAIDLPAPPRPHPDPTDSSVAAESIQGDKISPNRGGALSPQEAGLPAWALGALGAVVLALVLAILRWRRRLPKTEVSRKDSIGQDSSAAEESAGLLQIPNYRLLERADDAQGSESYLVEPVEGEGGPYVVKLPPPATVPDPQAVERFLHDANQSRRLNNRYISPVYDEGVEAKFQRPYYITDRREGLTLRQYLEQFGSLPEVEALGQVILPILHALDYAHSLSPPVVHRHLQPETVQVTFDKLGPIQDLKLLDYGIEGNPATASRGLPYTAPEVLEGHSPSPASDLFSLGVLFVEAVTGQLPQLREAAGGDFATSTDYVSAPIAEILGGLLPRDPARRHAAAHQAIDEVREALLSQRREMSSRLHGPTTATESNLS